MNEEERVMRLALRIAQVALTPTKEEPIDLVNHLFIDGWTSRNASVLIDKTRTFMIDMVKNMLKQQEDLKNLFDKLGIKRRSNHVGTKEIQV